MSFPVLKGAAYALIQANDMVLHQGSTQTSERHINPHSEHLENMPKHYRSFKDAVAYPPNQVYIGNLRPKDLNDILRPWYEHPVKDASREGKHGEMMPLDEFYGMMKAVDTFELVLMEEDFQKAAARKLYANKALSSLPSLSKLDKNYAEKSAIKDLVDACKAEPMYFEGELIGCVKKAHDFDAALSQHVMFENLVSKASAVYALALLLDKTELKAADVEYIIECSEEACGDMNQRGGGNFAKAIGEVCGLVNATGSDTRSFCAAPAHALVEASALVQCGIYKHVVIVAGGASAKLGLNAKDHVKKGLPILEDCLGAFAVHIAENDGVSPIIRTDVVGRHKIGSGGSPQAVMQAIVADPLDRAGISLKDVDAFSAEMQNPEITEPAGAGDVPKANYKMIAALGVMRKDFERADLNNVVERIGMPGFAPTQGHIPSGVPFLAHCRDLIDSGELKRAMIIGKGSLFLGRMTNLFDGVSFLVEANNGIESGTGLGEAEVKKMIAKAMKEFAQNLLEQSE
jgi:betaine reductase